MVLGASWTMPGLLGALGNAWGGVQPCPCKHGKVVPLAGRCRPNRRGPPGAVSWCLSVVPHSLTRGIKRF